MVGYRRWSGARGSFVCNASIVGLWLGPGGGLWLGPGVGLWLEVHLFVSIVGLWLGTGGGLWLEVHCLCC